MVLLCTEVMEMVSASIRQQELLLYQVDRTDEGSIYLSLSALKHLGHHEGIDDVRSV